MLWIFQVTGPSWMIHVLTLMFYFKVWAAVPPWKQGSLAEFVNLTEFEVSTAVILMVSILLIHMLFLRW